MKALLSLLMLIVGVSVNAQVGTQFPDMETETSEEKKIKIPFDVKGKFTLVGLAYSRKSEEDLVTWFQPVYTTFIEDPGPMSFGYDVNVYFIPMFTGVNSAAAGNAKKRAISGIDPVLLPHLLFFKGDLKPYKKSLNLE